MVATRNSLPPLVPASQRHWTSPRLDKDSALGCVLVAEQPSCLGKVAFASLWLLVFAIPWEDAVTISDFGTSARLIGMVTGVFGILAIVERGRVRRPSPGHFLMALFVVFAAVSYLWSLYPEGTLTQALTYFQLFTLVWLIWELSPRGREQKRLMQAYVFGTFVSGIDTVYLFLSHQESVYQRYAGARLDANDLGLMMALSIPVSYYLLIHRPLDSIIALLRRFSLRTRKLMGTLIHDAQRTRTGYAYRSQGHLGRRLGAFPGASLRGYWSEYVPGHCEPCFG